ncbi:MAG: S8 family serine peptidase [Alphaproteobacteria bacterium]|nr:S8 family serine peptidase [Alphaproteobacteria bacterium]
MTHIFKHFPLAIALMIGTAYAMDIAPQEIHSNPPTQLAEDGLPEDVNERNELLANMHMNNYTMALEYATDWRLEYPNNPFRKHYKYRPDQDNDEAVKIRESIDAISRKIASDIEETDHILKNMSQYKNFMLREATKYQNMIDSLKAGKFPAAYYLPRARKNANDLIGASKFQKDSYHNQEVIVLEDSRTASSPYLNYTNKENSLQPSEPLEEGDNEATEHTKSVSGVIGTRNTPITDRTKSNMPDINNHFKGVAPGVSITQIIPDTLYDGDSVYTYFSDETLSVLKKTKARVINLSVGINIYMPCRSSDLSQLSEDEQAMCHSLEEFFNIIEERDMIIVEAAGNEGLMLEKVDPKTGKPETDLRLGMPGLQYLNPSHPQFTSYRKNLVDLEDVAHVIPQLKDRVIFVGELMDNGIVPSNISSLPGALANDFIFAPRGMTLVSPAKDMDKEIKERKEKISTALTNLKNLVPELPLDDAIKNLFELTTPKWEWKNIQDFAAFGGTSGAAPRVSGALIILHQKFPDLPMTTIRKCLLESGYPFWKELPKKLFAWVRRVSMNPDGSLTDYGKMLFGHGRLDVEAAYHACRTEQDKLRARSWTGNKKK